MRFRSKRSSGFTLIEMLVVVIIVGVLATIGLPLAELAHKRAHEEELRSALREIRTALDAYKKAVDEGHILRKADESGFPVNLDVLVDGVEDLRSPTRDHIYFLRRLPADPFADDPSKAAAATWALRSYESPADRPQPGKDVYDVHSRSEEMGMNGIPYNIW
jgi:general secretion pathway protein G